MTAHYLELVFTPDVSEQQTRRGSREPYARAAAQATGRPDALGQREAMFLSTRDSLYLATMSSTGWPYIQHRGGPAGFVKVLGDGSLGFADYRGNQQYVTLGNATSNDRVALFFMDYVRRARLKILGRMKAVDLDQDSVLGAALEGDESSPKAERGFVVSVEAYDWNCPQYITPRYTEEHVAHMIGPLQRRIAELESALAARSEGR
jgi:uncharacterized protein